MKEYHKINTVFKRDERTKKIIPGVFSMPEFEVLKNAEWAFTEKIDGTNIRVIWDGSSVRFGGKTDNAQIPTKLLSTLQDLFPAAKMQEVFGDSPACLYGEGCGAGIQKIGHLYGDTQMFILFDVYCGGLWLERLNVLDIADKLTIGSVAFIGYGTITDAISLVRTKFKSLYGEFYAEGIVLRPSCELLTRRGERIIAKIKVKDFAP